MHTYLCRDDSPYPSIRATHPTRTLLPILHEHLFGNFGEFILVNELLYAELIFQEDQKIVAEIIDSIAMVDLRHFRMLGAIYKQCGGLSRVHLQLGNTRYIPQKGKEAITTLVKQKRRAIENYDLAINRCTDEGLCHVLSRIRADEVCHLDLLSYFSECFGDPN